MQTAKDLAKALLAAAELASNGKAQADQVSCLCQCTDSLIKLARLELEAIAQGENTSIAWLANGDEPHVESPKLPKRLQDIQSQIEAAQKDLDNPKTSSTMRDILEDKIQKLTDRLTFLSKTQSHVSE